MRHGPVGKGRPYLDANSQRIKSISNIRLSPELSSVNDAAFQCIKLYIHQRMQLRERREVRRNVRHTTKDW